MKRKQTSGKNSPRPRSGGFTLMELLIGIAVLAVLTTLVVPPFTQFVQNNRLAAQANDMVAAFQLARSEALKRSVDVRVCASDNGTSCSTAWTDGWIVFRDPDDTGNPTAPDDDVLRVWSAPEEGFQITSTPTGISYIEFKPTGASAGTGEQQFSLMLSGCTNDSARDVFVERTGRVASERVDCPE